MQRNASVAPACVTAKAAVAACARQPAVALPPPRPAPAWRPLRVVRTACAALAALSAAAALDGLLRVSFATDTAAGPPVGGVGVSGGWEETQDPDIVIEARRDGGLPVIRYRHLISGRRWEVEGRCDQRGDCSVGAVVDVGGVPTVVRDKAHLAELKAALGPSLGFDKDCPVTPEFAGCCPFAYRELEPAPTRPPTYVASQAGRECPAYRALHAENLRAEVLDTVDDLDYGRGLARIWRSGTGFVLVEHDVVPWPGAVLALLLCPQPWCGYEYPCGRRGKLGGDLGCVKVSAAAVRAWPRLCDAWDGVRWDGVDGRFEAAMSAATGQEWLHVHHPPVAHARRPEGWSA